MPTRDFAQASLPLFEEGVVDALEWSFDMTWRMKVIPDWITELLDFYSNEESLIGHGVSYSVLSAHWSIWHQEYLSLLQEEVCRRKYLRISEHFGYSRGGRFAYNTVLPVPYSTEALTRGTENLLKLSTATGLQIGLENLAFAFCRVDVETQGLFLSALLSDIDGYLLLDLHNLWCQMCNYKLSFAEVVARFPLHRVRELHVSGGSWSQPGGDGELVRRDTHDGPVPEAVFDLLRAALEVCPNVDIVIFERIGNTMHGEPDYEGFRRDFHTMCRHLKNFEEQWERYSLSADIVQIGLQTPLATESSLESLSDVSPINDDHESLIDFQNILMDELAETMSPENLKSKLLTLSKLERYKTYVNSFQLSMIETAQILVNKWGEPALSLSE